MLPAENTGARTGGSPGYASYYVTLFRDLRMEA
jgi:hypothetical protein